MLCQSISLASPFAPLPRAPRTRAALPLGSWNCISKRQQSGGAAPVSAQVSMPKGGAPVQALYELCRKTFSASGTPASSQAITKLCSLLDTIDPTDVGLKEGNAEDDRGHGFFGQGFFRNHHSTRRSTGYGAPPSPSKAAAMAAAGQLHGRRHAATAMTAAVNGVLLSGGPIDGEHPIGQSESFIMSTTSSSSKIR
ncbi:hypothetical protein ACLOJK_035271 [Asimina triloba]